MAITEHALAMLLQRHGDVQNDGARAVQLLAHAYRIYKGQLDDDHPGTLAIAQLFRNAP